ncbi:MAG: oligogalacturonate lyase family protein [Oscillospiraceae bacterium]|nr:oligogalacturonate lyase family protein [Oscillospiraceae bacterium]
MNQVKYIGGVKYNYHAGYYTSNKWFDNSRLVLQKWESGDNAPHTHVLYDIDTGEERFLCEGAEFPVVNGSRFYYTKGPSLFVGDINTAVTEELWRSEGGLPLSYAHVTNDGRYVGMKMSPPDETAALLVCDTHTGDCREIYRKRFREPFPAADHVMICPTDPNLLFFAHEGNTEYISNRLWAADGRNKTARCIAKQSLTPDGDLADCFGHEMWAPDGRGMYFVKYQVSLTQPKGICYVDLRTSEITLVASAFRYWHAGVSADGKKLVADTAPDWDTLSPGDVSEVICVDLERGTETLVARAASTWKHPCHPHPQFSPDADQICFTTRGEHGKVCVGIVKC